MRYLQIRSHLALFIALLTLCAGQLVLAAEILDDTARIAGSLRATVPSSKIESSKPLAEELAVLLGGKFKWSMEPNTVGLKVGPMDIPGNTLDDALRFVVNAASADYRVSGDSIVIFKLPNAEWNKLTGLDAQSITLEKALNTLFSGAGVKGSIEPSISQRKLNFLFTEMPLGALMNILIKAAGADYKVENDSIKVFDLPSRTMLDETKANSAKVPAAPKLANEAFRKIMETPLYLEFVQMPLNAALEAMLRGTGLNYTISPEISAVKVNATLKNITLERALREVINAVGADYRIANNTVRVTPPKPQSEGFLNQMQQYSPNNQSAAANNSSITSYAPNASSQKLTSKSIGLKNLGAADVAPAISQPGIQISSTNSKNIVITGSEEQVKQAENLINALDSEQNLPKQIKVTIAVRVKNDKTKGPRVLHSLTLSTTDGEPAMLETNTTIPSSDFVHVINRVTPIITQDGRIAVEGFIKLNWKFRDSKRGEINYISPEEPFEALLVPGKEQLVAQLKIGGGINTVLDVTATAVIDRTPGKLRQR